jgi:uncharacterized protein involved in exopolysaccharide biosynthesis
MSARTLPELDVEQEIDLRRWRDSLVARWWLPAAGLAAGIVLGLLVSLGGAQVYRAEALLSLGQPFSPAGTVPVNSFATNPRAVAEIIRSESALKRAARAAGLRVGQLRGKVSSQQVGLGAGAGARALVPLIELSVQGSKPAKVARAANELAKIVVQRTTASYVGTKIATYKTTLTSIQDQLNTITPRITALEQQVDNRQLAPIDRLILATQLDNAQQRRGQLLDLQTQTQQQLALAENVESARVIEPAASVKTTARSRRNSILVGALIGLLVGVIAALAADAFTRPKS